MLACYNRKEMTYSCLKNITQQTTKMPEYEFDFYVYDDGSSDGTGELIKKEFPKVNLMEGEGLSFWCKSMHHIMCEAVKKDYNFYLAVNDDVEFDACALETMFHSYFLAGCNCGIVGTTKSFDTGEITYGGRNFKKELVEPDAVLRQCYWANWNCFLIDNIVIKKIGIIDGKYQHAWGDFDYSYMMQKAQIPIYVAIDYVGQCNYDSPQGSYQDSEVYWKKRLEKLNSPKGIPFYSYLRFNVRTDGLAGLIKAIYGYSSYVWHIIRGMDIE